MLWPTVRPPPRAKHSLDFISQKISSLETFQAERLGSLWAYFDSVHDNDATVTVEPDTMHLTHDVRDNIIKRSKLDVRLTMLDDDDKCLERLAKVAETRKWLRGLGDEEFKEVVHED